MKPNLRLLFIPLIVITVVSCSQPENTTENISKSSLQFPCGTVTDRTDLYQFEQNKQFDSDDRKFVTNSNNLWRKRVLKVFFYDLKDDNLIKKTLSIANEWSQYSKVKFILTSVSSESDIRICFRNGGGYASLIGNEANLLEHLSGPTMWLENLDKQPLDIFRRVVLHEFGHALGLEHELQNPSAKINWNLDSLYVFYKREDKWDSTMVKEQILDGVVATYHTQFDPNSIMIYAVPAFLLKKGCNEIPWPNGLSALDKANIGKFYK